MIKFKQLEKRNQDSLRSMGIVFLCIVGLYIIIQAASGLYPFGETSNLLWDQDIQYVDYFAFYRDVLLGEASLGYSFTKSAGGSLIALFGYYLGCPLNLLVVFFKTEQLPMFLFLLTALKLGLAGVTVHIFLRGRFGELSLRMCALLSVSYGLMQYSIIHMSNIMWLDGVILLPLLLLSVYRFIAEKKKTGLFLLVLISVAMNWYTGYMTGLFSVCYFFYERLLIIPKLTWDEVKRFFCDGIKCAIIMVAGILGSCFIFYPVFKGLQKGKQVFDPSIFAFETYDSLIDVFRGFAIGSVIPTVSLYCGLLFLGFFLYYFFFARTKIQEKMLSFAAVAFMFASCWIIPLDCIWSGFRFVASYRFRYSFIVIFLVLYLAARGAMEYERQMQGTKSIEHRKVAVMFGGCMLLFLGLHLKNPYGKEQLIITLGFLTVYIILFLLAKQKSVIRIAVPAVLAVELILNGVGTFRINYQWNPEISAYTDYVEQSAKQITMLKEQEDAAFYRMDTFQKRYDDGTAISAYLNESMVYGYHGLNHYSSTYDTNISDMIYRLGYSSLLDLSIVSESILPSDALFGMKYVLSKRDVFGYDKVESIPAANEKSVYYNPYALELGMTAADSVFDEIEAENPFEYQNQLFSNILGRKVELFQEVKSSARVEENTLIFALPEREEDNHVYGFVDSAIPDLVLHVDGNYRCNYAGWLGYKVFSVGSSSGQHQVELTNYTGTEENMTAYFYCLDQTLFQEIIQELQGQQMHTEVFDDGVVKGSFSADTAGNLLLTIPYDDGWKAAVNGESVEIKAGADALMVIPLQAGDNQIEMEYVVPGLSAGFMLTIAGILLFLGVCWFDKRKN